MSFVGLAKFYVGMIPDFDRKILLLYENRKDDFRREKEEQSAFENIKMSYVQSHLFSLAAWQKKQPWQKTVQRKQKAESYHMKDILESMSQGSLSRLCGPKIEIIPARKEVYSTNGPQTSQISLCTRRGNSQKIISERVYFADGIQFRIEIYTRRADPPGWSFDQTRFW